MRKTQCPACGEGDIESVTRGTSVGYVDFDARVGAFDYGEAEFYADDDDGGLFRCDSCYDEWVDESDLYAQIRVACGLVETGHG